ncbi:MAG: hypothetical protein J5923_01520 [Acidaminococcaceae bacterium]|nr:hypothetical protein [Acidaminococcaceae bacterium]
MPIQLIIFLTKNKIFACEINNNGQADAISINGNSEIKCEGKESVDEMMDCLYDAFSIDGFGDEHFDIVIVDCGGDKTVVTYASERCMGADKLSIIGVEKLLPLIVWNKTQLQAGEEIVAAFDDACYKVACDDNNIVKYIGKARKGKENISLDISDFGCLYYFDVGKMKGGVVDTKALQEKDDVIEKLQEENDKLMRTLNEKENALTVALTTTKDAEQKIAELNAEKVQWEKDHPKPSNLVEQMVKIVEKCKNEAKELGGDLYIRGSIPKKKLVSTIDFYSNSFDINIDANSVVALYYNYAGDSTYNFNSLLITSDFFCYDKDGNQHMNIIYWGNLVYAYKDWDKIYFTQSGDDKRHLLMGNDEVQNGLLIPMFNKLKDVDELQ